MKKTIAQKSHPMTRNRSLTERKALTTVPWKCLPAASSRTMRGRPHRKTEITYGMRYAPPPFCPTTAEKRQMLAMPTAEPIAARMNPFRDDHCSMLSVHACSLWYAHLLYS